MTGQVLFVGDIHLGRRPLRLPPALRDAGVEPVSVTPAAAWRRVVEWATKHRVDAVVLAGDVVDAENRQFEAYGRLKAGVEELARAGIPVWGVSGNHDWEALPRLADSISDFRLLGRDGQWELATIRREGEALLHVVGWSFPRRLVRESPFAGATLPAPPRDDVPTVGVLHADLLDSTSPYAPVTAAELDAAGPETWFLGHIHDPDDFSGGRRHGYLGTIVGLHPGETGAHGPVLVTIEGGRVVSRERIPLAPLRWERVTAPIEDLPSPSDPIAFVRALAACVVAPIADELDEVLVVGGRVEITGTVADRAALRRAIARENTRAFVETRDGVVIFLDRVVDSTRPDRDLARLAEADDPVGLLARDLVALERSGPETAELLREAREALVDEAERAPWNPLDAADLGDAALRRRLLAVGRDALEGLMAQTPDRDEGAVR